MKLTDLFEQIKLRIDKFGDMDVVFRMYEETETHIIAHDYPLSGYVCDDDTNEFCLMDSTSFDVYDKIYN